MNINHLPKFKTDGMKMSSLKSILFAALCSFIAIGGEGAEIYAGEEEGLIGPKPVITEFMASNKGVLNDEDGDFPDWIEVANLGDESLNLSGWSVTDDMLEPSKWVFPEVILEPGEYLIVFASDKDRAFAGEELHTNFKISAQEGYLGLYSPKGEVVSEYVLYPSQYRDVSYGLDEEGTNFLWFEEPTPGKRNGEGFAEVSPEVNFSHNPGVSFEALELELTTSDPDAVIHYSLDGFVPTETSPVYTEPILLNKSSIVKAVCFSDGKLQGPPVVGVFIIAQPQLKEVTSDLPLIIIDHLQKGEPGMFSQTKACMAVFEPVDGITSFTNSPVLMKTIQIRKRGNSSALFNKYGLAVELEDPWWEDEDQVLLGMPAESDWVFYGPTMYDTSMIRNQFMYSLSNQIGRYAARFRECELYFNQSNMEVESEDYFGIYVVIEKPKLGEGRINYEKVVNGESEEPGISGSYLMRLDLWQLGGFEAAGTTIIRESPDNEEMQRPSRAAQKEYQLNYMNEFYAALKGELPGKDYNDYLDVPAAIDHNLLNAFAFNMDALRSSTYFTKVKGGKLVYGPIWDFDRSLGSGDGHDSDPYAWNHPRRTDYFNYGWWYYLFRDIDFFQQYIDRWQELREGAFSGRNLTNTVNQLADVLREAERRDFERWGASNTGRGNGFQETIDHMLLWISHRLKFIDSQFVAAPEIVLQEDIIYPHVKEGALVYYTLDGSDPRLPGGEISPQALLCTNSIKLSGSQYLVLRTYDQTHDPLCGDTNAPPLKSFWSGPVEYVFGPEKLAPLAITELMYSPALSDEELAAGEEYDDYAWLEISNVGERPVNMDGIRITGGIEYTFPKFVLLSGQSIVVAKKPSCFIWRYGEISSCMKDGYSGNLSRKGEILCLEDPNGIELQRIIYSNQWYSQTDRGGYSLQVLDPELKDPLLSSVSNWLPSSALGGTPGVWEGVPSLSILPDSLILSEGKVSFTVERSRNFNFQVEQSSDLINWTISEAVIRDDQVEIPVSGNPDCYYRLRIP